MRQLARVNLLILDDWGPEPLLPEQARDLLEIVEDRYDAGSLLITSQVPVDRWYEIIGIPTLADAVLDRRRAQRLSHRTLRREPAQTQGGPRPGRLTCRTDLMIFHPDPRDAPRHLAAFKSERWPASRRNSGRLQIGIPGRLRRNTHPSRAGHASDLCPLLPSLPDRADLCVNATLAQQGGAGVWTASLDGRQNRLMRPRGSRPDALQSVTVLEAIEGLAVQHGAAGVPFKDLEDCNAFPPELPRPDRCAKCFGQ